MTERPTTTKEKTPELFRYLDMLPKEWKRDQFILCGSAGLAFRGVRDIHDLDILILPELWGTVSSIQGEQIHSSEKSYDEESGDDVCDVGVSKVLALQPPTKRYPRLMRLDSGIDIFDSMPKVANVCSFFRAKECSDKFEDPRKLEGDSSPFQVLSLRHILAIKALAMVPNRKKDLKDMRLLTQLIQIEEENFPCAWMEAWKSKYVEKPKAEPAI